MALLANFHSKHLSPMKTFRTLSFATLYFFLLNATSIAQVYQTISTYAGPPIPFEGTRGFAGDGGPATSALLNDPKAVAVDTAGSLYIADTGNHRIRKVASNGIITTIAGSGTIGFSGDGGPAVAAELNFPQGVAVDSAGNV